MPVPPLGCPSIMPGQCLSYLCCAHLCIHPQTPEKQQVVQPFWCLLDSGLGWFVEVDDSMLCFCGNLFCVSKTYSSMDVWGHIGQTWQTDKNTHEHGTAPKTWALKLGFSTIRMIRVHNTCTAAQEQDRSILLTVVQNSTGYSILYFTSIVRVRSRYNINIRTQQYNSSAQQWYV